MVRRPPLGMASRALTTRFINTWPIWLASAMMLWMLAERKVFMMISSPMRRDSILVMSSTMMFRLVTFISMTCLRLKASNCWVRLDGLDAGMVDGVGHLPQGIIRRQLQGQIWL